MTELTINELCDVVRQTSYDIHLYHGHGHVERVYENALAHRLRVKGYRVEQQPKLDVFDEDGTLIGEFHPGLIVDSRLLVELKAVREILDEHVAQTLGYLKASRLQHGLLINFGSYKFQIKKYIFNDRWRPATVRGLAGLFAFALGWLLSFR